MVVSHEMVLLVLKERNLILQLLKKFTEFVQARINICFQLAAL